jgi:galactonate dehydratase
MKIDRMRAFMTRDKDRPRVIVAIDTDDGLTGWGECYNHGPDKALPPLLDYLMTFLKGQDPTRIEHLVRLLVQQARFPPGALGLAAIAAIDHCLWDISAKALGVPVYKLIGGNVRDRVKVYAGVYTAPDPGAAREEFDRLNAQWGMTAFKLSPYRVDMHRHRWGDVVRGAAEYFRALRETVRADYEIAFDAHAKIVEVGQAIQLGNALAPYDPLFFEEPLRPENIEAWGDLKRGLSCTLATGE